MIWDIAVNESLPFNKVFLVGLFDSVTKLSQVQFCSVGEFDGEHFDKVLAYYNYKPSILIF